MTAHFPVCLANKYNTGRWATRTPPMSKMFTDEIVCEFKTNTKNKTNYTNFTMELFCLSTPSKFHPESNRPCPVLRTNSDISWKYWWIKCHNSCWIMINIPELEKYLLLARHFSSQIHEMNFILRTRKQFVNSSIFFSCMNMCKICTACIEVLYV
jgi:hypothetical protein